MHGRRRLPELEQFFSDARRMHGGVAFTRSLFALLPRDIMKEKGDSLCDKIYNLRTNGGFFNFLLTNWQLSEAFLDAVIANASPAKRQAIKSSRFSLIYQLNALRRAILPQALRVRMPIEQQQNLVQMAMAANRAGRAARVERPPVVMPDLGAAGMRTQMIERLDEGGKVKIPKELICPLSQQMFVHPVKVVRGHHVHYFERDFIVQALGQKKENPLNRQPLDLADLVDAPEKAAEVEAYKRDLYARINEAGELMSEHKEDGAPDLQSVAQSGSAREKTGSRNKVEIEAAFQAAEAKLVEPEEASALRRASSKVFNNEFTRASGTSFKTFLTQTKETIVDDFAKDKITKQSALNIANAAGELAGHVAACTVRTSHLTAFLENEDVQAHMKKSTRFGRIVGGLVGAVLGVIVGAVVGFTLGAGTGPGAVATAIMGAIGGGIAGAAILGYGSGYFSLWRNPLSGLHRKAKEVSEKTAAAAYSLMGSNLSFHIPHRTYLYGEGKI